MEDTPNYEELKAIEEHKYHLSQQYGYDVGFELAKQDWMAKYSAQWRMRHMLELQRAEINRHKWIESEKAQRDLGADAVFDWINTYAAQWREWYEREYCRHLA